MSETMSDWPQFYDQGLSNQEISNRVRVLTSGSVFGDQAGNSDTNAAVVNNPTVTSSGVTLSSGLGGAAGSGGGSSGGGHFSVEGRVGKPVRRRSRASRRTPTTLLNTDTTNFRAMVQQFTGGPSAPFSGAGGGSPNFGLGFGTRQPQLNPNNSLLFPPPAGFHLQYQHQQQQQQSSLIQHPNQPLMFSLNGNNNNNNNPGTGTGDVLFQRLGGGGVNMEGGGGVGGAPPGSRTSESSNENRSSNPSRLMF